MENTEKIILNYFFAWQNKDWTKLRDCLAETFNINAGQFQLRHPDEFLAFCKSGPCWKPVKILESLFSENRAALLYEGTAPTGEKVRIGEFLEIKQDKIVNSKMAISLA